MEKLIIIRTPEELQDLQNYLLDKDYVAFDTETTGVDKEAQIVGISVSAEVDVGYYIILSYWDVSQQKLIDLEVKKYIRPFIDTFIAYKSLVMHNAVFDCAMVENNFNVKLMPYVHTDTMILAQLLDENRSAGLKELGSAFFGDSAKQEQLEMKESVKKNGGFLTKQKYELYKADAELLAKYGAKDAILTLKLAYILIQDLNEQSLESFFYEEESMPLLRGPTYDLNTTGLRVDPTKLQNLRGTLEAECMEDKSFIYKEIDQYVKEKYKGTGKSNTFNIQSSKQLAWLLFFKLGNEFHTLTKGGRELCKALEVKVPYGPADRAAFIRACTENKGKVYEEGKFNWRTKKDSRPKKVGDPWNYIAAGKESLVKYSKKYKWVDALLRYAKNLKLLNTYAIGIQSRMKYNVIRPEFKQIGTTSGRYSSKNPNFQNLPRDDKRIKSCIVARPGKVFVGADYAQLEPRVFASFSGDKRLLDAFKLGHDPYSVIGVELFEKFDCSLIKSDENSFAKKHSHLRDISKVVMLSATYGTTPFKMAPIIGKSTDETRDIINNYFDKFPSVLKFVLETHEEAKQKGQVSSLYGRIRRIPEALTIKEIYGDSGHDELPYYVRNMLNLSVNHKIQSTAATIMNRAAIKTWETCQKLSESDNLWSEVRIVLQVHDELVLEGPEALKNDMAFVLKEAMETTTLLPDVDLVAEPKTAYNFADLK